MRGKWKVKNRTLHEPKAKDAAPNSRLLATRRGLIGSFHHVSIKHLPRYCNEFSYRFTRRGEQAQMFDETLRNLTRGEALPYAKLTSPISA